MAKLVLIRCSRSLGYSLRLPLLPLEAGSAEHRPALRWLERDRGLHPAFRAGCPSLRANPLASAGTLRLALLAVLGVVGELLVVEE